MDWGILNWNLCKEMISFLKVNKIIGVVSLIWYWSKVDRGFKLKFVIFIWDKV